MAATIVDELKNLRAAMTAMRARCPHARQWLPKAVPLVFLCALLPGMSAGGEPWAGAPVAVPATLQAENFDRDGEGLAYHDSTAGNAGGTYRPDEDVDIIAGSDVGYVVNNFQAGEWIAYTIDVPAADVYTLELRVSTNPDFPQPAYHVEVDGAAVGSTNVLADTGGWDIFQWLGAVDVSLPAGAHNLRIVSDREYFNLDAWRLRAGTSGAELMPASEAGWSPFAARPQTAPGNSVWQHSSGYVLQTSGNGVHNEYGGWRTRIGNLQGEQYYRFRARAKVQYVDSIRESVSILLRWRGNYGGRVAPDYVWDYQTLSDGTLQFDRIIKAPPGTQSVDVELVLQWAPSGILDVGELSFRAADPVPSRPARVAAVYFRPAGSASGVESVARAADYGRQVAAQYNPDIMVFGELLNVIGAPGSMDSKAEAIPGTSSDLMAAVAREYGVNIVVGLLENADNQLRNTAVLIDRNGEITGRYHKVQLPQEDASAGIEPGNELPVFHTDVGKVAMLICHDISFPEAAREVALHGAEIVLLPIWGGKPALVQARAIENSVYVVSSGYDYASDVVNPLGEVLARIETLNGGAQVAIADIDLAHRFREDFLGDWRDISNKQRRSEPYTATIP